MPSLGAGVSKVNISSNFTHGKPLLLGANTNEGFLKLMKFLTKVDNRILHCKLPLFTSVCLLFFSWGFFWFFMSAILCKVTVSALQYDIVPGHTLIKNKIKFF